LAKSSFLRESLSSILNHCCRSDSNLLSCTLESLNTSLIKDINAHYKDPKSFPAPSSNLLVEFNSYLELTGMDNPSCKVYTPLDTSLSILVFLTIIGASPCYSSDFKHWSLIFGQKKGGADIKISQRDGMPFMEGVKTILHHIHCEEESDILSSIGQFIRSKVNSAHLKEAGASHYSIDVMSAILFLENLVQINGASWNQIETVVPPFVLEAYTKL